MELVLGLPLLDVHAQLQGAHVASELGHGIDAALVEKEAVGATMCVAGGIVNHGLIGVCHRHILVSECPAVGFHTGLGGGGGGVGVEVVGVGEVCHPDGGASARTQLEGDVVDIVAAVFARLA